MHRTETQARRATAEEENRQARGRVRRQLRGRNAWRRLTQGKVGRASRAWKIIGGIIGAVGMDENLLEGAACSARCATGRSNQAEGKTQGGAGGRLGGWGWGAVKGPGRFQGSEQGENCVAS